jgi:SAM-dependent methyltransferase
MQHALMSDPHDAAFKAFEAAGWSDRAESYTLLTGAISQQAVEPLLDAAGVGHGSRLLDVATGPGEVVAAAAGRGARPVGVDLSEGMVALARDRHPGLDFRLADAEELPLEDALFDSLTAAFVLNHLPRPERALAEAARVLVPGGRAAFTVWDRPERTRFIGLIREAIDEAGAETGGAVPPGPDPFRFADDREFGALLERAGLVEVDVRTLELAHRSASADELWEGMLGGSVRTSSLILAQPEQVQRLIRAGFERRAEALRDGDEIVLPAVVKLASGRRP